VEMTTRPLVRAAAVGMKKRPLVRSVTGMTTRLLVRLEAEGMKRRPLVRAAMGITTRLLVRLVAGSRTFSIASRR